MPKKKKRSNEHYSPDPTTLYGSDRRRLNEPDIIERDYVRAYEQRDVASGGRAGSRAIKRRGRSRS